MVEHIHYKMLPKEFNITHNQGWKKNQPTRFFGKTHVFSKARVKCLFFFNLTSYSKEISHKKKIYLA